MSKLNYTTRGGITVTRTASAMPYKKGLKQLLHKLDRYRGIYLSSGYEYPERYSRWDVASICPPVEIVASGREVEFRPLNQRGEAITGCFRAFSKIIHTGSNLRCVRTAACMAA